MWRNYPGQSTGSEGGTILRDEANDFNSRITLEVCVGRNFSHAITCGLPGHMIHTAFASSEEEATATFEAMKDRLDVLGGMDDPTPEVERFLADF